MLRQLGKKCHHLKLTQHCKSSVLKKKRSVITSLEQWPAVTLACSVTSQVPGPYPPPHLQTPSCSLPSAVLRPYSLAQILFSLSVTTRIPPVLQNSTFPEDPNHHCQIPLSDHILRDLSLFTTLFYRVLYFISLSFSSKYFTYMLSPILLHHEHRDHVVSALSAQNYVLYDVRLTIFTDVYLFCSEKELSVSRGTLEKAV